MGEAAMALPLPAGAPLETPPTVGRVVLYAPTIEQRAGGAGSGEYWPAVITRVWSAECVNLQVLTDGAPAFAVTSVMRVRASAEPRTWRWAPRA
jgi:hypothetical protein